MIFFKLCYSLLASVYNLQFYMERLNVSMVFNMLHAENLITHSTFLCQSLANLLSICLKIS